MKKSSLAILGLTAILTQPFISCRKGDDGFAKVSLIPVSISKDKWSFVDPDGKIVMEDEFNSMPTAVYNGFFSVEQKEDLYAFYKADGDKYDVLGNLEGLYSVGYMEEGLVPASLPKGRIAVYDDTGKKKFDVNPVGGKEIKWTYAGYSDGLLGFKTEDDKGGYLDKNGKVAIKPEYDLISQFNEGLATVFKINEETSDTLVSVINTKGETVFKLKQGQSVDGGFANGYVIAHSDGKSILYNREGEALKFKAKIPYVVATDGKFVIFCNSEGQYGVADMDGEIVIKEKYDFILFDNYNFYTYSAEGHCSGFFCYEGDVVKYLDTRGKEKEKYDYKSVLPCGEFGLLCYDGKSWSLRDMKDKDKCPDDFRNVSVSRSHDFLVYSDYIDIKGIAAKVASFIDGEFIGGYQLGIEPSVILAGKAPADYAYSTTLQLDNFEAEGYRYTINGQGIFNDSMAEGRWDYDSYSTIYAWNPDAHLNYLSISVNTDSDLGTAERAEFVNAIKQKGFSVVKEGFYDEEDPASILKKGDMIVLVRVMNGKAIISFNNENYSPGITDFLQGLLYDKAKPKTAESDYGYDDDENSLAPSVISVSDYYDDYYDYDYDYGYDWEAEYRRYMEEIDRAMREYDRALDEYERQLNSMDYDFDFDYEIYDYEYDW